MNALILLSLTCGQMPVNPQDFCLFFPPKLSQTEKKNLEDAWIWQMHQKYTGQTVIVSGKLNTKSLSRPLEEGKEYPQLKQIGMYCLLLEEPLDEKWNKADVNIIGTAVVQDIVRGNPQIYVGTLVISEFTISKGKPLKPGRFLVMPQTIPQIIPHQKPCYT